MLLEKDAPEPADLRHRNDATVFGQLTARGSTTGISAARRRRSGLSVTRVRDRAQSALARWLSALDFPRLGPRCGCKPALD